MNTEEPHDISSRNRLGDWINPKARAIHPEETISVDPDTGGEKGVKPARMSLIPTKPLDMLARVYGYGSDKYEDNNWRKGYVWSKSYDALLRHLNAFWGGEDDDPESGLPHMAHAAWHCFALMTFTDEQPNKDDRFKVSDEFINVVQKPARPIHQVGPMIPPSGYDWGDDLYTLPEDVSQNEFKSTIIPELNDEECEMLAEEGIMTREEIKRVRNL